MLALPAFAQDPRQIILEVQKRQHSDSQRYEGTLEVISQGNQVATKRWVYQRIGSFGNSKAILRFTAPAEVKGVGLLIVNHPDRASDQWMWRPAIGRDQRIALQDRSTRFFGTDFSFEDLEERDVDQYDYKLLADEGGMWKIESRPRKSSQYAYSYFWIKKDNYTFVKIEAYGKKGLVRTIDYKDYEQIKGIWTARDHRGVRRDAQEPHDSEVREAGIQSADEGRRFHPAGSAPRLMSHDLLNSGIHRKPDDRLSADRAEPQRPRGPWFPARRRIVRAVRILAALRTALACDGRDRLDPRGHDGFPGPIPAEFVRVAGDPV